LHHIQQRVKRYFNATQRTQGTQRNGLDATDVAKAMTSSLLTILLYLPLYLTVASTAFVAYFSCVALNGHSDLLYNYIVFDKLLTLLLTCLLTYLLIVCRMHTPLPS